MKTNPQLIDLWTSMLKLNVNLPMYYRCSIIKSSKLSWIFLTVEAMPHGELGLSIESTSHRILKHSPPFYRPCPGHVSCTSFTSISNWAWLTKPFLNCQITSKPLSTFKWRNRFHKIYYSASSHIWNFVLPFTHWLESFPFCQQLMFVQRGISLPNFDVI